MARLFYFYIDPISDDSHREKGTHPEAVDAEKTESSVILVAITVTENHQEIQLPQRCTTDGWNGKWKKRSANTPWIKIFLYHYQCPRISG